MWLYNSLLSFTQTSSNFLIIKKNSTMNIFTHVKSVSGNCQIDGYKEFYFMKPHVWHGDDYLLCL